MQVLAIAVGLSTFGAELYDRKVIVYSDNTGAEVARHRLLIIGVACAVLLCRRPREKGQHRHGTIAS